MLVSMQNTLYQMERYSRCYFEAPAIRSNKDRIFLASFPKSGNTWLRFVVANVNALKLGTEPASFKSIESLAPVVRGNRDLNNSLAPDNFPLFLKTHFPYTKLFSAYKSVVIVRDPFKVIPSYHNYLCNARNKKLPPLEESMFHWRYGFNAWANFMESWDGPETVLLRYEDLQSNPHELLSGMYKQLGYPIDSDTLQKALSLSVRDKIKKSLTEIGDHHNTNNFNFVREASENKGFSDSQKSKVLESKYLSKTFIHQATKHGYI